MKPRLVLVSVAFLLGIAVLFVRCGSNQEAGTLSTLHDARYVGQGSVWEWDLTAAGTFTATRKANRTAPADLTITGTYATFSTGFYKFTVTNATGTDAPAAGAQAYGFAVPGVILMVKPLGGDNPELMVMPAIGPCPSGEIAANWVQAKTFDGVDDDLSDETFWGTATFTVGSQMTGTKFNLAGTHANTPQFPTTSTCTDGIITITGGDGTGYITMTEAGVGLVQAAGGNAIIALPRETSVTTSSLNGRNFVALMFAEDNGDGEVRPMNITIDGNGSCTYTFLTDVETGAQGETGACTIVQAGDGTTGDAGFVKIKAQTNPNGTPTLWAAVSTNIGSTGRAGFVATGLTGTTDSFSMVAIQK